MELFVEYRNFFTVMGDLLQVLSILILLKRMITSRSSAGLSGKTQFLYLIVFVTRYWHIFLLNLSVYHLVMKYIFIVSYATTTFLIYKVLSPSYDHVNDSYATQPFILICVILAFFFNYKFEETELLWTFSVYLEAIAANPQLHMVVGRAVGADKTVCQYLFILWSYKMSYIFGWICRYYQEQKFDVLSMCAGGIQVLSYCDLFGIYFGMLRGNSTQAASNREGVARVSVINVNPQNHNPDQPREIDSLQVILKRLFDNRRNEGSYTTI